jgi:hypothetical protein
MNKSDEVGALGPRSLFSASAPHYVVCDSMSCRLHVWAESEWAARSTSERPIRSERVPGLGWLVAIPVHGLN